MPDALAAVQRPRLRLLQIADVFVRYANFTLGGGSATVSSNSPPGRRSRVISRATRSGVRNCPNIRLSEDIEGYAAGIFRIGNKVGRDAQREARRLPRTWRGTRAGRGASNMRARRRRGRKLLAAGQYASFAAIAPSPGWSLPFVFYNYGGSVGAGRLLPRGHLLSTGLSGSSDSLFITPTYTPDTTVLGARPNFSLAFAPSYSASSATVSVGPLFASRSDSLFGGSDLYPTAQLFWNLGNHNLMAYLTGGIPVGSYSPDRLSNIGLGHAAIDAGGAYTYLNMKTGTEFSATFGLTKNFENPSTNYTNGINSHLDLALRNSSRSTSSLVPWVTITSN